MEKGIVEEKYRIITKYLSLLIDEKDFITKEDIVLILEALNQDILITEQKEGRK